MEQVRTGKGSRVYSVPLKMVKGKDKVLFSLKNLLTHYHFRLLNLFDNEDLVGIKINIHDGPSHHQIDPAFASLFIKHLKKRGVYPFLCDTTGRYQDRKVNAVSCVERANLSGFGFEKVGGAFLMLDGPDGRSGFSTEVSNVKGEVTDVHLVSDIQNINGMIVLVRPESNEFAGFSGALKTLGADLASKRGKIMMYSKSKPCVDKSKCFYCRKCMHKCPVGAITVDEINRNVEIDHDICINCGICVEVAKYGGIAYDWDADPEYFQKHMIENAMAVKDILGKKMLFANFLMYPEDMTKPYDEAEGFKGILVSRDPVALDKATYDLTGGSICYSHIKMNKLFEMAQKCGLGSTHYDLVDVSY